MVAIKIPTDSQYLRNLKGEGVAIHGLVHPNIVRAIGFDPYAEVPYLTMEYVPGTSLRPLIQKKSLTIPQAVSVMRQILAGLKYAHDHNVIHRDIKPENVLIHERALADGFDAEGVVKITDFGLGKAANNAAGSIAYSASLNTAAGREIAGTLDYMAPEQRGGGEPQAGRILSLRGDVVRDADRRTAGGHGSAQRSERVGSQVSGRSVPEELSRLDKRYASAGEFLAALPPAAKGAVPRRCRAVVARDAAARAAAGRGDARNVRSRWRPGTNIACTAACSLSPRYGDVPNAGRFRTRPTGIAFSAANRCAADGFRMMLCLRVMLCLGVVQEQRRRRPPPRAPADKLAGTLPPPEYRERGKGLPLSHALCRSHFRLGCAAGGGMGAVFRLGDRAGFPRIVVGRLSVTGIGIIAGHAVQSGPGLAPDFAAER